MNYPELNQMEIGRSINEFAEVLLPRFSDEKVLVLDVNLSATNHGTNERHFREVTLVLHRPNNFMFVGIAKDHNLAMNPDMEMESFHDSCWRDGVDRAIRKYSNEIWEAIDGREGFSVFNTFGIIGPRVIAGYVATDSNERTGKFVPIEKEDQE